RPVERIGADEFLEIGLQDAGHTAHNSRDYESREAVAVGGNADPLHTSLVGFDAADHKAETRFDDAPHREQGDQKNNEDHVIERHAIVEIQELETTVAALGDGQSVIASIKLRAAREKIQHLRQGQG